MGFNHFLEAAIVERSQQELFNDQCKRLIRLHDEAAANVSWFRDPELAAKVNFYRDMLDEKRDEAQELGLKFNVQVLEEGFAYVVA